MGLVSISYMDSSAVSFLKVKRLKKCNVHPKQSKVRSFNVTNYSETCTDHFFDGGCRERVLFSDPDDFLIIFSNPVITFKVLIVFVDGLISNFFIFTYLHGFTSNL